MVRKVRQGTDPWYYYVIVTVAMVLIFAQGYNLYHRSVGPTDGAAWNAEGLITGIEPGGPAQKGGLQIGDRILVLDGISDPTQLRRQLVAISDTYKVGDRHQVTVERQSQRLTRGFVVESNFRNFPHFIAQMSGNLVALAFLTIGLSAFLLKPGDPLVLLFCLAFAATSTYFGAIFPVYLRRLPFGLGHLIWMVQTALFSFALPLLLHFFLTFPAPVGLVRRWPRLTTLIYLPSLIVFPLVIIKSLPLMYNVDLNLPLEFTFEIRIRAIFVTAYLVGSVVALATNYLTVTSPDHRRRMRVLTFGTILGFLPSLLLRLRTDPTPMFDTDWEAIVGLAVVIMPLSFAYTIIKHRLFDLRLVIRRSLQYALARHVLFAAFISPAAILVIDMFANHGDSLQHQLEAEFPRILLYVLLIGGMVGVRRPLMNWLDRKFFREAYDGRKILSQLAEEIGLVVNIDELSSMVLRKIDESLHLKYGALMLRESPANVFRCVHYIGSSPCSVAIPYNSGLVREVRRRAWRPLEITSSDADLWTVGVPEATVDFLRQTDIDIVIPLRLSSNTIGLLLLGEKQSEEPYSKEDIELLMTVAAQTALGVERARLSAEMAKEETLKREVEIAQEVQARLFPQSVPRLAGLDIAGACQPAQGVSGDYYDFLPLAPGRIGVAIGDIAGKGISAALLMANLQATLRSQAALAGDEISRLLGVVNTFLFHSTSNNKFATLFYATYDQASRHFTYANAGHNSPLLVRHNWRDGTGGKNPVPPRYIHPTTDGSLALAARIQLPVQVERLETGGMIIGAFESPTYEQDTVRLDPGDIIVAFTDGVIEAQSPLGEAFGEDQLEQIVLACCDLPASEIIKVIIQAIADFTAGTEQHDDITLVVMKVSE